MKKKRLSDSVLFKQDTVFMKGVGEGGRMLGQLRCGFEFLTKNFMVYTFS